MRGTRPSTMPVRPRRVATAALAAILVCVAGCDRRPWFYETHGETMGTTYTVKVAWVQADSSQDKTNRAAEIEARVAGELRQTNDAMSTYIEDSEISRLNRAAENVPFGVSPELYDVLQMARQVSEETGGAFDVTVAPAVDAWGFGPQPPAELPPAEEALDALRNSIGFDKLHLDDAAHTVTKLAPGMRIDLSAIAKGYGVDRVALALENLGYTHYMVEIGGEVRTAGHNRDGVPWRIGIEQPTAGGRSVRRTVPLSGLAMATSGDYRNFRDEDGMHYAHTIDPRTARPVTHSLASVTVLHGQCAMADAYATAFMVLGPEEGRATAERLGLPVLFILHAGGDAFEERVTTAFPGAPST